MKFDWCFYACGFSLLARDKRHVLEHSLRQVLTKMWRYVVRNQRDNQERRPTSTTATETSTQVCDESPSLSSSTRIQQRQQDTHGDEGAQNTEQQPKEINVNAELRTAETQQQTHETVEAEVQVVEEVRRPNVIAQARRDKRSDEIKLKYESTKRSRKFNQNWKKSFPWVTLTNDKMFCSTCLNSGTLCDKESCVKIV